MGRPRQFDEQEVLQRAMEVFWRHGYDATTMKLLQAATGVDGRGLVNALGDKETIFLKVLDRYLAMANAVLNQVFAEPSFDAVRMFFGAMLQVPEDPEDIRHSGCLMVNTVFELGRASDRVREKVEQYRALFRDSFYRSLEASGVDHADQRSEFLVGMLWGALSQIRLAGNVEAAQPMVQEALSTIERWPQT